MKSKRVQYLEKVLRWMAIIVLKKYKPSVVGITGSVGKTSTKEAVFMVLSQKFRTRKSERNYNNEIGIPLTIIGAKSGKRSPLKWLGVFIKWLFIVVFPVKYPKILVLEMGVDRPGDMKYLTSFIPISVGIITNISSSHLEFFKSVDHIAKEKRKLLEALPEDGMAILNYDDPRLKDMKNFIQSKTLTFGLKGGDAKADIIGFNYQNNKPSGISFKLCYEDKTIPVRLRHVLAQHQLYAILAGISAGITFKINLVEIAESLDNFFPPAGRMNLIHGINSSFVIDDAYNASPASAKAALDVLMNLRSSEKIVALGDMLELGSYTENGHREVARKIFQVNPKLVFLIGDRMKIALNELERLGYPSEKIFHFDDPFLAINKIRKNIKAGDLILVKGSQAMRMEKIVKGLMLNPREAENILCRQSPDWLRKEYLKP